MVVFEKGEGFLPVLLGCRCLCAGLPLRERKGTAPVQVLGRFNWILGLKVFVKCFFTYWYFWILCAIYMNVIDYMVIVQDS